MKFHPLLSAYGFSLILSSAALAQQPPATQPDADQVLRQMSAHLAAAQHLSFHALRKVATSSGGADKTQITVTIQRPDKLAAKSVSAGDVRHLYADGRSLTVFDATKNFYTTIPMRTSLDGLVHQLATKYGFTPPLAELAVSNVYEDIRHKAQSVTSLGRAYLPSGFLGLGGVECHRLALAGKAVDAELWVAVTDLLPRKLLTTHKDRPGQPQIEVRFSDWNLAAPITGRDFTFVAPKGARKIPMLTTAEFAASAKK